MDGEAGFLVFLYLNETEIRSVAELGIPFAVSALVGEKGDSGALSRAPGGPTTRQRSRRRRKKPSRVAVERIYLSLSVYELVRTFSCVYRALA